MENWVKKTTPEMGDLIRVKRKAGYCHFGIAISNKEVIHYSGLQGDDVTNPDNIKIRQAPLTTFVREDELEVLDGWYSPFNAKQVVKRAKAYLDCSYFGGRYYNFVTNNCEHFARFVYYGDATSVQVNNGIAVAAVIGGAILTGAGIAITNAIKENSRKPASEENAKQNKKK